MKFFVIFFCFLFVLSVTGQSQPANGWDSLKKQYESKALSEKAYMKNIDSLISLNYLLDSLEDKLSLYKILAWSKKEYVEPKMRYWSYLGDNARLRDQGGRAVYFFQKMEEIAVKENLVNFRFIVPEQKMRIYSSTDNHAKFFEEFAKVRHLLDSLPTRIERDTLVAQPVIANTLSILYYASYSYASVKDTANTLSVVQLAENILSKYNQMADTPRVKKDLVAYNNYLINFIRHSYYWKLLADKKAVEEKIIPHFESLINGVAEIRNWRAYLEVNVLEFSIDYYLLTKQNEKAETYLKRLQTFDVYKSDSNFKLPDYLARLSKNRGNMSVAYEYLKRSAAIKDSLNRLKLAERDDLWYAFTESEYSKAEIKRVEAQKRRVTTIIYLVILAGLILVTVIYLFYRKKDREKKSQIESLNNMMDFQISAIEERQEQQRKEEQKKIGRELHDELASLIATIQHRVDMKREVVENMEERAWLSEITHHLNTGYQKARAMSHDLYNNRLQNEEESFARRIYSLISFALPDAKYEKKIVIDDNVLNEFELENKIHLLYIIHEAVVNIIKHAQATKVDVLLYKEDEEAILLIKDNGKGMLSKYLAGKKSVGLESIRERVSSIGGTLEIQSSEEGTELCIQLAAKKEIYDMFK